MKFIQKDRPNLHIALLDHLQKTKKEYKNLKKLEIQIYIHQSELDKTCFQHDMVYGDFKDLKRRADSDKILHDKAFNIPKNPKYDGHQRILASMVYNLFDETIPGSRIKNENMSNKELAEELRKTIIKKFKKRIVYSPFIDNIWGVDLADMHLINKFNKGIRFSLYAIDVYSKYAWVIP